MTVLTPVEEQLAAPDEVEHAARRADHDLRAALEALDLAVHRRAAVDGDGATLRNWPMRRDLLGDLHAELAGRGQDQRLHVSGRGLDLLDDRDAEGGGLAGARLRLADQVLAAPQRRDGARLDLGRASRSPSSRWRARWSPGTSISPKR